MTVLADRAFGSLSELRVRAHDTLDQSSVCKFYQFDKLSIFKSKYIEHFRCEVANSVCGAYPRLSRAAAFGYNDLCKHQSG